MKVNVKKVKEEVRLITISERQKELDLLLKLTAITATISTLPDLYYKVWVSAVALGISLVVLGALYYFNTKGYVDKVAHVFIFFFSVILFINGSQVGFESFSFLYYVPLIIVTPFVLDYKNKYWYYFHFIHPVVFIMILFATDFSLFATDIVNHSQSKVMAEFNLMGSLFLSYYIVTLRIQSNRKSEQKYEKLLQDLDYQNEQLQKTNTELDRFVYSVSHDLRAPIASSLGLVELSKLEKDVDKLHYYNLLKEKTLRRLDDYVNSLLNFSRNYRVEIENDPIDFKTIIEECIELNKPYGNNDSKLVFKIDVNQESEFISDELRIRIVLNNLISNALKYHDENAQEQLIAIAVFINSQRAVIKVRDNGIGIEHANLKNIFDMFYRASEAAKGSGLGLYITKEAVEKIGGQITVDSIIGSGTTFLVDIPNRLK